MAARLGSIGQQIDAEVRAGATFGPFSLDFFDEANTPVNLVGSVFDGAVSRRDAGATADVPLSFDVSQAAAGRLIFSVPAATTVSFAGPGSDFFRARADYAWALNVTDSTGTRQPVCFGVVFVAAGSLP
jgi:hypothetical protein